MDGCLRQGMESAYCSGEEFFSDCSENGTIGDEAEANGSEATKIITYDVDVAIIGNGPSAIFLSLLLSGYVPYFAGNLEDSVLGLKLEKDKRPIVEQDLQYLSEGLQGRSKNPVALLFDALFHPNADIGQEQPSSLRWVPPNESDGAAKRCTHIVIGEEQPGGQWHVMDKSILTLSLSNWLELPLFSFKDWKQAKGKSVIDEKMPDFYPPKELASLRAAAGDIAEYYTEYVKRMDLSENFKNGLTVEKVSMKRNLSVRKDKQGKSETTSNATEQQASLTEGKKCCIPSRCRKERFSEDNGVVCPLIDETYRWTVKSKRLHVDAENAKEEIHIQAKKLVLAGGLGAPMKLGVAGEDRDYVLTLKTFRERLREIKERQGKVLIVGAGMSGADTVLLCLREGIPCYHAFKQKPNDPGLMLAGMEPGLYQEYYHVSALMKRTKTSPLYTPLGQHVVDEFKENGNCLLKNLENGEPVTISVTAVVVMIGYCTNLDYLPEEVRAHLYTDPAHPVHNKKNPLDVDLFSFKSEVFPNLYALGPLTGDNFVRFVFGSGLGCAQNILYKSSN